ncbi:eCIS core domain-containing protein [Pseudotamlana agarivorans]|uniref:eCIS core domain-containing protein n=1 Tax=Pseudotamlana agarivorans TaxID=481183 RepID=UPI00339D7D58
MQTKLTIGQPNDKYEKEADTMADAVVNNSSKPEIQNKEISSIQRESLATPQEDEKLGTAEQRIEEDKLIQEKLEVQRLEEPEEDMVNKLDEEEEGKINKMEGEEEEGKLQTKSNTTHSQIASNQVSNKIKRKSGQGRLMSENTKTEMESSFGTDFSDVNIHTDDDAIQMNKELGAQAFTHGKDVYFNSGKYNPDSSEGKHLLAHELTHVVQQNSKKKIQREAETDALGNYTNNYIFRNNTFFRRIKRVVSDGILSDDEIRELKTYAIGVNGTVKHSELLLMAAMRQSANVTLMNSYRSGNLIIPMTAIPASDRDYVMNIDRGAMPADIQALRLRRFLVQIGLNTESMSDLNNEIDVLVYEQIIAAGGNTFRDKAEKITFFLMDSSIPADEVLSAMINAAADSTSGDKVMAGITYIIAKEYNHPMATRLLNGTLKIDALIPRVYRRLMGGGEASYQYSTDGDLRKADTLYLPTSLDLLYIRDRALIMHELTHASDDFSSSTVRRENSIDLEMTAYRAQGRYIMDGIRSEPSGTVPGLVTAASEMANEDDTHYWAFISAAKRAVSTCNIVLNEILTASPTSKSSGVVSTDLGNSLTTIDANLRAAIINMKDSRGRNLYNPSSNTILNGASGHFFH